MAKMIDVIENAKKTLEKVYHSVFGGTLNLTVEKEDETQVYLQTENENIQLTITCENGQFKFYPEGIKHYHGVRYYKDGSGEPDSYEPFDLLPEGTDSLRIALSALLKHIAQQEYEGKLEVIEENLFLDDLEPI